MLDYLKDSVKKWYFIVGTIIIAFGLLLQVNTRWSGRFFQMPFQKLWPRFLTPKARVLGRPPLKAIGIFVLVPIGLIFIFGEQLYELYETHKHKIGM